MARASRIIVPGVRDHLTRRRNRRQKVFLQKTTMPYIATCSHSTVSPTALPAGSTLPDANHGHLISVPSGDTGLSGTIGEAHRRYSGYVNARLRVAGNLFQCGLARWRWTKRLLATFATSPEPGQNQAGQGCDGLALVEHPRVIVIQRGENLGRARA